MYDADLEESRKYWKSRDIEYDEQLRGARRQLDSDGDADEVDKWDAAFRKKMATHKEATVETNKEFADKHKAEGEKTAAFTDGETPLGGKWPKGAPLALPSEPNVSAES